MSPLQPLHCGRGGRATTSPSGLRLVTAPKWVANDILTHVSPTLTEPCPPALCQDRGQRPRQPDDPRDRQRPCERQVAERATAGEQDDSDGRPARGPR